MWHRAQPKANARTRNRNLRNLIFCGGRKSARQTRRFVRLSSVAVISIARTFMGRAASWRGECRIDSKAGVNRPYPFEGPWCAIARADIGQNRLLEIRLKLDRFTVPLTENRPKKQINRRCPKSFVGQKMSAPFRVIVEPTTYSGNQERRHVVKRHVDGKAPGTALSMSTRNARNSPMFSRRPLSAAFPTVASRIENTEIIVGSIFQGRGRGNLCRRR